MKVLLSGYYGFYNIGDEAILSSLVQKLRQIQPDVDITVLTKSPEETRERLAVRAVPRKSIYHLVKEILRTDIYLSGGGSLFQDDTSNRSLLYYVLSMTLARVFGKKTASISCGVGPLHKSFHRWLVRLEIEHSVFTSLRDPESYDYLRNIGVKTSRLYTTADLAMGLDEPLPDYGRKVVANHFDLQKPIIALALRSKDFEGSLIDELVKVVYLLSEKYDILFLPFYLATDTRLKTYLQQASHHDMIEGSYFFFDEQCSFEEYLSMIQYADLLIGSRLHSLIFSLIAKTEYIGLSYDPKVDAFLHLSNKKAVSRIEDLKAEELVESVNEVFQQVIDVKSSKENGDIPAFAWKKPTNNHLASILEQQKKALKGNDKLLKELLCDQ